MINLGNMSIADLRLGAAQVKALYLGSEQIWGGEEPVAVTPLTFTALQSNSSIRLNKVGSAPAVSLEYSTDGSNWSDYTWSGSTGTKVNLANAGDSAYFRAKNDNAKLANASASDYCNFVATGKLSAYGNMMTLLKGDGTLQDLTDSNDCAFACLFDSCTALVGASQLELPSKYVPANGYANMFYGCSNLSAGPDLPALSANYYAYGYMFSSTGLVESPQIAATKLLSGNEYYHMFEHCSSLSSINVNISSWASNPWASQSIATTDWVVGVAASGTFTCPERLGTNDTITRGTSYCPNGWNVLNLEERLCFTATQANSTVRLDKVGSPNAISLETSTDGSTWSDYSWSGNMGDTVTLANVGDKVYFRAKAENQTIGSSSSNYFKFVMSGQIAASGNIQTLLKADGSRTDAPAYCYTNMFRGCSSLTTAPSLPAMTLANYCYTNMFRSCTSLTSAPALPATTLAQYCYQYMFNSCTSLTSAPTTLPATTLAEGCYTNMFEGCTSLTTAPALLATTVDVWSCYRMFYKCSSLTTAPSLSATTLSSGCYQQMFTNCTSLSAIDVAFTDWSTGDTTTNWLQNVAASGTFTCPATLGDDSTIARGISNCPDGWAVVNT